MPVCSMPGSSSSLSCTRCFQTFTQSEFELSVMELASLLSISPGCSQYFNVIGRVVLDKTFSALFARHASTHKEKVLHMLRACQSALRPQTPNLRSL